LCSCKKDSDEKPSDPGTNSWGNSISLIISGKVEDAAGVPLAGAVVKAGNLSATTDNNGIFILKNASGNSSLAFVQVEKAGYFSGSRSFLPTTGGGNLRILLLPKTQTGSLSASVGGTVNHSSGAQLMLESGSVTKNGAAYSGNVKVFIQSIDPTTSDFESRMPGNLIAMDGNAARGLKSFGMMAAELQDEAGEVLQIAAGKKAHIKFPIPAGLAGLAADSIDLWSYDEAKGYWKKEGRAGKEGNFYHAMVGHFSFWNCDVAYNFIELKGRILSGGQPLVGARIRISSQSMGSRSELSNAEGRFGGFVPKDESLTLTAEASCGGTFTQVYSGNIGPFASNTTLSEINVTLSNATQISGKITGCNNAAISGAYVVAGEQPHFTDAFGNYSLSACGSNLKLTAYGSNPWGQGSSQTVVLSGGNSTVNLQVCNSGGNTGSVTDIDGNTYQTVQIGTQTWMAENLKTTKYRNGDPIPTNLTDAAWNAATTGAYAIYNNDAFNNTTYGKLYNWYAVTDSRNLCPVGWHVPTDTEWKTLEIFLGMSTADADLTGGRGNAENVGGKLKSTSILWTAPNTGATNESGFSGLPGGLRDGNGSYYYIGFYGYWWSSTESSTADAWSRYLLYFNGSSHRYYYGKHYGFSVRCLRD
jgi:uncharacterized protein (TIGR02145 family)